MSTYRTHMMIIGDVLRTAEDARECDGASITYLIRKANVSYGRITKILETLVAQGLLEQVDASRAKRYRMSATGREFLAEYRRFSKFSESFGMAL